MAEANPGVAGQSTQNGAEPAAPEHDNTESSLLKPKPGRSRLEEENELYREELLLETKHHGRKFTSDALAIVKSRKQLRKLEGVREEEERQIQLLKEQLSSKSNIVAKKSRDGGRKSCLGRSTQVRMENQLHQLLVSINKTTTSNQQLRAQVNKLRKDRCVFHKQFKKLRGELEDLKVDIKQHVMGTNELFHHRENTLTMIKELGRTREEQLSSLSKQWDDLGRKLALNTEVSQGSCGTGAVKAASSRRGLRGNMTKAKDNELRLSAATAEKEELSELLQTVGVATAAELIQDFRDMEASNFGLFKYGNKINGELEALMVQHDAVVAAHKQAINARDQNEREGAKTVGALQDQLAVTTCEIELEEGKLASLTEKTSSFLAELSKTMLQQPFATLSPFQGDEVLNTQVSSKVVQAFGLLEDHIDTLMPSTVTEEQQDQHQQIVPHSARCRTPRLVTVQAPRLPSPSESHQENWPLLSMDELRAKAAKNLADEGTAATPPRNQSGSATFASPSIASVRKAVH